MKWRVKRDRDYAKKATWLSVGTTGVFMLITQTWAWYAPADGGLLQQVFSNSPRIMLSSLVVYAICMLVQIAAYKFIWTLQKHREMRTNGSGQVYPPCLPSWLIPSSLRCSPSSVSMNLA